jgi:hypothetical protein
MKFSYFFLALSLLVSLNELSRNASAADFSICKTYFSHMAPLNAKEADGEKDCLADLERLGDSELAQQLKVQKSLEELKCVPNYDEDSALSDDGAPGSPECKAVARVGFKIKDAIAERKSAPKCSAYFRIKNQAKISLVGFAQARMACDHEKNGQFPNSVPSRNLSEKNNRQFTPKCAHLSTAACETVLQRSAKTHGCTGVSATCHSTEGKIDCSFTSSNCDIPQQVSDAKDYVTCFDGDTIEETGIDSQTRAQIFPAPFFCKYGQVTAPTTDGAVQPADSATAN